MIQQVEEITPSDRKLIIGQNMIYLKLMLYFSASVVILLLLFAGGRLFGGSLSDRLILLSIMFLPLLLVAMFYFYRRWDLTSGKKQIIEGEITDKYSKTRGSMGGANRLLIQYYKIGNKAYPIPMDYYSKFKTGDRVRLHIGIRSRRIFLVELV